MHSAEVQEMEEGKKEETTEKNLADEDGRKGRRASALKRG
jgi:hypothetical protein